MTDPLDVSESSAERLAREFRDLPAERLRREYEGSSVARLAQQYFNSPIQKAADEIRQKLNAELTGTTQAARLLAQQGAGALDPSVLNSVAHVDRLSTASSAAKALTGYSINPEVLRSLTVGNVGGALGTLSHYGQEISPNFANAITEATRVLASFGEPHGGITEAVRALEQQTRSFQTSLMATLSGVIGEATRANQWAGAIGSANASELVGLYGNTPNIAAQIAKMQEAVHANFVGPASNSQAEISAMLGLNRRFDPVLATTSLKMSAFAGVAEVAGIQSPAWDEAYEALFGEWRTRPGLPTAYWRNPRTRRRMYDAAEVDPGLAGAGLDIAVEVMVESGLATGVRSEANAVAIVRIGDVSMTIRSRGTRNDAFALLSRFEEELRDYITRKLSDKFGPDWFKLRVDGNTAGNAKRARLQALQRDEAPLPLINYTDLGDLSNVIRAKKNWQDVFEDIFINQAEFDHDMQKLIATRRPTMHTRPIDGVRLVELVCVIQRISKQMADDGAWKLLAETDG